jgi:mutator family transposase
VIRGPEPRRAGVQIELAAGTSKSVVSRRFVARTEHAVAELLAIDLTGLDLVALMVDGIRVAEHRCVVALGITLDGTKIPLALAEGATENATVLGDLLAGLRGRGLDTTQLILVVIDGAKALRRAVTDAFYHPVILRARSAWPHHPRGGPVDCGFRPLRPLDGHSDPGWPMRSVEQSSARPFAEQQQGNRFGSLSCGFGARGRIRTDDLPITSRSLTFWIDPPRPILAAQVRHLFQLDPSGRAWE